VLLNVPPGALPGGPCGGLQLLLVVVCFQADNVHETQAARGENQPNRTGSTSGPAGGAAAEHAHAATVGAVGTTAADFADGAASSNHILAGSGVEGGDAYGGYPSVVGGAHNGAANPGAY
jgi:hypothetical protein